jgi:dihydrodipicolinate reductase
MAAKVAIHGAGGRLGALIAEEAGDSFVGGVSRNGDVPECDVVIDVTSVQL